MLESTPHHFTMYSDLFGGNSAMTNTRLVNNTNTFIPGQMETILTEEECPQKTLNNQLQVLYRHSCYDTPLLSNVLSYYCSIKVDEQSQLLRLLLWFEVNVETGVIDVDKLIIFKRENLDFGDVPASPIMEVALAKNCAGVGATEKG